MENSSPLISAAFLARETLDLQVTKFDWPERLQVPVHDHEVRIKLNGVQFTGRGVHEKRTESLEIAIAEAFERSIQHLSPVPINAGGIAVHLDAARASNSATKELIERDAFFCHFLTSTPMSVAEDTFSCPVGISLKKTCIENGLELYAFSLNAPKTHSVTLVAICGHSSKNIPFGIRIALGCSDVDRLHSQKKAIYESLPMMSHAIFATHFKTMNAEHLKSLSHPTPLDHRAWALNEGSRKSMDFCLNGVFKDKSLKALDVALIQTHVLEAPLFWPKNFPLVAVRCSHPNAALPIWGDNLQALKYSERLSNFMSAPYSAESLPALPHPLG